ncbi:MAG TPA: hypothetical protein VIJ62_01595, partial [Rhizomicrobium sp.]
MRRDWRTWALRAAAICSAALALFVLLALAAIYTPPGHAIVAQLIAPLTGGEVSVSGLSGDLFHRLRVRSIALRDADGEWLRAENIALDWHALSLLDNRV